MLNHNNKDLALNDAWFIIIGRHHEQQWALKKLEGVNSIAVAQEGSCKGEGAQNNSKREKER